MKIISLMAVCLLLAGASARAAETARPWAEGISSENQEEAFRIFREANALFEESKYMPALARYREALKVWDHPAIRYNTAVALIHLDQPLAAYENLEAALQYQEAPFDADTYRQAQLYRRLLSAQLSEFEVVCTQSDVEVILDGEQLPMVGGTHRRRLPPGPHQLVARKAGYNTETEVLHLVPGKLHREEVTLQVFTAAPVKLVRRWPVWMPWSVLAGGAAVALIGVPLMTAAQSDFDTFDADLARVCPAGCTTETLPQTVLAARNNGRAANGAAIGMFAAGGALLTTGVVLIALNGLRPEGENSPAVTLAPVVGPGVYGVTGQFRF